MENAVLEGAKFELIDWNGNVVSIKSTNEDGIMIFDDLKLDKEYTVKEIEAPEGYIFDEKEVYKFVLRTDKEKLLHEVKKEKKTYDTDFKIVDLNGTGIQGAEFRLYNLSDLTKVVAEGNSNQEIVIEIVNEKAASEKNEIPHTNGGNNQNDAANIGDNNMMSLLKAAAEKSAAAVFWCALQPVGRGENETIVYKTDTYIYKKCLFAAG